MNDQKIELPPLPEWLGWPVTVSEMTASEVKEVMQDYALAAVEADRQRRGEPVGWMYEDELPSDYPYEVMHPYSKVDGVRMFPVFAPQPPVPVVKESLTVAGAAMVPSDDEILAWAGEEQFFLFADAEEVLDIVKSALQHFGHPIPSKSAELKPAAQAQPVVNKQLTTGASDALADTQRAIIEAAERRGYERGLAECTQDREDAERYRWLRNRASAEGICVVHIDYWSDEYQGQAHCEVYDGEFLDRAIDHARRAEGGGE